MNKALRDRLLATTIIAGAAVLSTPSFAQTAAAPAQAAPTGAVEGQTPSIAAAPASNAGPAGAGEIVVTGSRIPQPNLNSVAPVTVVSAADIKLQGTTRVEDILNSLPQVFATQTSGVSNGATGTATVDLRGLGDVRTLVLINGRRLLPGDPTSSAADLNNIPASLIKRVDVLTGGASATYGADAVAGVVNFVMDTDYTGFKIDSQYSLYQNNNDTKDGLIPALQARNFGYPTGNTADGGQIDVTATFGVGFDDNRGHIVAYGGYRKINAVTQDSRDYSACTSQINTANKLTCGGSATSANGTVFDFNSNTYQVGPGRTLQPGFTPYNFAPTNYYQRPDERYTAGFFAHYDVGDAFKPYMEAMFMDDRSVAQIAPSGDFGNTLTLNCDNPLLSAQALGIVCAPGNVINGKIGNFPLAGVAGAAPTTFTDGQGVTYNEGFAQLLRRNVEGGSRRDDLQHTSYRGVIGAKGDLGDAWSYDAYYQYGRTNYAETYTNDFSVARLTNALNVVSVDANGREVAPNAPGSTPTCRSVVNQTDLNCVPYDIFGGSPSQAAINYLSTPGFKRAQVSEQVASASITGQLGKYGIQSPWAHDGVAINIGAEYRKESLNLQTDEEFSLGDLSGQGGATLPVSGSFNVKEVFTEVQVPIVQDGFVYNLSFDGGYRYSHYKVQGGGGFNTNTFKAGVEFAPVKDVLLRGSYNRAIRAPNIQELFAPQNVALDGTSDPCAGSIGADGTVNGNTAAQCALTGVTAAQFGNIGSNPAAQYNGLIGGNINLKPEKSTTKSFGVVLQPRFIPHLALSVDYFDINVKNAIQTFGENTILNSCISGGDPAICGLIHRDAKGSLWLTPQGFVSDLPTNIGGLRTKGLDVNASYSMQIGNIGSIAASVVGTYTRKFLTDNGISPIYDCAGLYGPTCGNPRPKWRHKARLTYTSPSGIGISAQWRYVGKVDLDLASDNPSLSGAFAPHDARIGAQSYFDLAVTAKIGDHYNFRLGMDNILDKEPPIVSANGSASACQAVFCNGNTYPGVYDALGRYIYAGLSLEF